MVGPGYWELLNSAFYFLAEGSTSEEAFNLLVAELGEGYWYAPEPEGTLIYLDPEVIPAGQTARRGFILIEDSPAEIVERLREADSLERPWLEQWASAVESNPDDIELRAQALVNLPDIRIVDRQGPIGCLASGSTRLALLLVSRRAMKKTADHDGRRRPQGEARARPCGFRRLLHSARR